MKKIVEESDNNAGFQQVMVVFLGHVWVLFKTIKYLHAEIEVVFLYECLIDF